MSKKNSSSPTLNTLSIEMGFLREDMKTANLALWGRDGRGGIVKDISDMSKDVKDLKADFNDFKNKEKKEELSTKWKLGIATALISAFALVIAKIIEVFA